MKNEYVVESIAIGKKNAELASLRAEVKRLKTVVKNWETADSAAVKAVTADNDIKDARIRELEEALPDPFKLRALADWLDIQDAKAGREGRTEVQSDLRRWANAAAALQEPHDEKGGQGE